MSNHLVFICICKHHAWLLKFECPLQVDLRVNEKRIAKWRGNVMKTKLGNVTASSLKCVPIKWRNKLEYRPLNNLRKVLLYLLFLTDKNQFFKTYSIQGGFFLHQTFSRFSSPHVFFLSWGIEIWFIIEPECEVRDPFPEKFMNILLSWKTKFLYKTRITCIICNSQ